MIIEENYSNDVALEELNKLLKKFSINSDESNNMKKDLERYRSDEIKSRINKKLDIEIPKEKKYNGNKNYFLEQRNKKGRTIDCAYLYGNKDSKTFIGFQIKCYFSSTTSLNKKAWSKNLIRFNLQKILINSMILFDCKITNWFYYLIFYINPNIWHCNVNGDIIRNHKEQIEILFYDPLLNKFYNCENNCIDKLKLTEKSNLDKKKVDLLKYSLNANSLSDKFDANSMFNEDDAKECFLKDFSFLGKDINKILSEISVIMGIQNDKLYLKIKAKKVPYIPESPHINYIFLYVLDNGRYIGAKSDIDDPDSLVRYYDIKERKEINIFIAGSCEYYYIIKRKRKRVYNNVKKRPMEKIFKRYKPRPTKKSRSLSK